MYTMAYLDIQTDQQNNMWFIFDLGRGSRMPEFGGHFSIFWPATKMTNTYSCLTAYIDELLARTDSSKRDGAFATTWSYDNQSYIVTWAAADGGFELNLSRLV